MLRQTLLFFAAYSLAVPVCHAQAFMEAGGVYAGVAGLGAGLAASQNHGQALRSSYELAAQAQQALVAQNKAIAQYLKMGADYEAKKDWAAADKCFKYVLQVVNRRDGPGSAAGLPALKHLVKINVAQNRIDDAIGFQKTVVAFTQGSKKPDAPAVLKSQLDLSFLFFQKGDYTAAEPVLQQSVALAESPRVAPADRRNALVSYSQVLRKLKKSEQADVIDARVAAIDKADATASTTADATAGSPADGATGKPPDGGTGKSISQPINQSVNQPISQPISQPINQPVSQPINQPISAASDDTAKTTVSPSSDAAKNNDTLLPAGASHTEPTSTTGGDKARVNTAISESRSK